MLLLPVFRVIPFIAAVLALAGCHLAAVVPQFAATAGYRPLQSAQRLDTITAVTVRDYPITSQRRINAEIRPLAASTQDYTLSEKKKPAGKLHRRHVKTATGDTVSNSTWPVAPHEPRQYSLSKFFSVQTLVHYSLHFVFPVVLALVFFPLVWQTAYLIMLATMLMDLDHLLAKPIFDPLRCSVGYHPLHSFYAVPVYALLLLFPATQIIAVGLLFHLFTDTVDCLWNFSHCHECYLNSRIYALRNWARRLLGREAVK